jgi:hypothetical protein
VFLTSPACFPDTPSDLGSLPDPHAARGIPTLMPVSRPPSADMDHSEGIYTGAVFLVASFLAAQSPESLGGPVVFGLISLFVGKEARLDSSGWWIVPRVGFFLCVLRRILVTIQRSNLDSLVRMYTTICSSLRLAKHLFWWMVGL